MCGNCLRRVTTTTSAHQTPAFSGKSIAERGEEEATVDGTLAGEFAVPSHAEDAKKKMSAFAERHVAAGRRAVFVTSGGTRVPLESRAVRFLDNFSSGRRGAISAEYFLDAGYAVIFLHRRRSLCPYARLYAGVNLLDALRVHPEDGGGASSSSGCGEVVVDQQALPNIAKVLKRYQEVKESGSLLPVEFSALSEYLHLLKAAAEALGPMGSRAMFYLAAAVSDFYVPASEMPEHKIQSSDGVPLRISMRTVPKILSPLARDWAPRAFVVSFKLETDPSVLLERSRRALATYGHQAVVANALDTRRGRVVVVTADGRAELTLAGEDADGGAEIEEQIVSNLTAAHGHFITKDG